MAICPIIVHFSTWRARSMHDVACEFARAAERSKDAQKQLARSSGYVDLQHGQIDCPRSVFLQTKATNFEMMITTVN